MGTAVGFDAEGIAELFTALGEGAAQEGVESGAVGLGQIGDFPQGEPEDGGLDVGLGVEDAAGQGFEELGVVVGLKQDGDGAVIGGVWGGGEALGGFFL